MSLLLIILIATTLSGVLSLLIAFFIARQGKWEMTFSLQLTAFAAGVMLATAILHLLPEAVAEASNQLGVFQSAFAGVALFFLLERSLFWFHHHHDASHYKPTAWLVTLGDGVHNFMDGVTIAVAFLINPAIGLITTIAVGFHEIPQEIADFVVLINSGFSNKKALLFNFLSALTALVGAIIAFHIHERIEPFLPYVIGFAGGMFLYIALSDLIPELHVHDNEVRKRDQWLQVVWFVFGIILLLTVSSVAERYMPEHADRDVAVLNSSQLFAM